MLTIISIHILEFITLGLVFLSAFRIFKELSLEANNKHTLSECNINSSIQDSNSLVSNQSSNQAVIKPDSSPTLLANNLQIIKSDYSEKISEKIDSEIKSTLQNQALLKNYIGDFF